METTRRNSSHVSSVGICGVGMIGESLDSHDFSLNLTHYSAFNNSEGIRVVSHCDFNEELSQIVSKRRGGKGYTSLSQMLENEELDILVLSGHHDSRVENFNLALTKGIKKFVIEKPVSTEPSEIQKLKEHADKEGAVLIVNYIRRFTGLFEYLDEVVQKTSAGKLKHFEGVFSGEIEINGVHLLDILSEYTQLKELSVSSADNNLYTFQGNECSGSFKSLSRENYACLNLSLYFDGATVEIKDIGRVVEVYVPKEDVDFKGHKTLSLFEKNNFEIKAAMSNMAAHINNLEDKEQGLRQLSASVEVARLLKEIE